MEGIRKLRYICENGDNEEIKKLGKVLMEGKGTTEHSINIQLREETDNAKGKRCNPKKIKKKK